MPDALLHFQKQAEEHLEAIEALLDPRAKLTLVVRMPWLSDGDIVLTVDDLAEVERAIRRRREVAGA